MKLVVDEPESAPLRAYLIAAGPLYASRLAGIELRRAVRRQANRALEERAEDVLGALRLVEIDDELARTAGELAPPTLRTLDALHLAAALALGDECDGFVCYDERLSRAASDAGLTVLNPS